MHNSTSWNSSSPELLLCLYYMAKSNWTCFQIRNSKGTFLFQHEHKTILFISICLIFSFFCLCTSSIDARSRTTPSRDQSEHSRYKLAKLKLNKPTIIASAFKSFSFCVFFPHSYYHAVCLPIDPHWPFLQLHPITCDSISSQWCQSHPCLSPHIKFEHKVRWVNG